MAENLTMAQTLKMYENALKENYLPVLNNQLGIEPSPFLAKIKKIPLKGDKIVATAPVGLSGGFGFGEEGKATPTAGNVRMEKFIVRPKDMYVNIAISAKAVRLTSDSGAMANALDTEVQGAFATAKWNVGRSLFGNGTGVLAKVTASDGSTNTISVDDTKFLKEGLMVDIYAEGGGAPVSGGECRRILAVDRVGNTVTVSGTAQAWGAGFMTVQNSYNREITGLGAIMDTNVKTLYGMDRGTNPFMNPIAMDADGDIDDGIITKVLRRAQNEKGSNVDTLLCGDAAYDHYVTYLRTNNIRVEDMSKTITGGFKAIKFVFANREVDIINESFVPDTEMWGVDSTKCALHSQEWEFADLQGGGIFNLMEGQSIYRALLANYGDLICENPGGCIRLYDVGYKP